MGGRSRDAESGAALTAEEDEARGEDGVDEEVWPADLDEEGGVADEGDGEVAGSGKARFVLGAGDGVGVRFADEFARAGRAW